MSYDVPQIPGEEEAEVVSSGARQWPMWEVFVRQRRGLSHVHAGSLHAPDAETASQNARDVYTRRSEGVSIWVVPSSAITATDPADADAMFDPFEEQPYRHATYYEIPDEVGKM
jgi:ring-1,2-phenylacetyl-CoA epoxidase subunit PaaB